MLRKLGAAAGVAVAGAWSVTNGTASAGGDYVYVPGPPYGGGYRYSGTFSNTGEGGYTLVGMPAGIGLIWPVAKLCGPGSVEVSASSNSGFPLDGATYLALCESDGGLKWDRCTEVTLD